jgi:hypothetical protein
MDRLDRLEERIMDRLDQLEEPGPPEPFEWTDADGDDPPGPQTARGADDPPAGDWPAGVDESHRISLSCLGVLVGASLARNALRAAGLQLIKEGMPNAQTELLFSAVDLLQPPLEEKPIAKAYDKVREWLKGYKGTEWLKGYKGTKLAALATREVLVLHISANEGALSKCGFENALERAFGRQCDTELRSQLNLAWSAICRLGRDYSKFRRAAPKIFCSPMMNEAFLVALFRAYSDAAATATASTTPAATLALADTKAQRRRKAAAAKAKAATRADSAAPEIAPQALEVPPIHEQPFGFPSHCRDGIPCGNSWFSDRCIPEEPTVTPVKPPIQWLKAATLAKEAATSSGGSGIGSDMAQGSDLGAPADSWDNLPPGQPSWDNLPPGTWFELPSGGSCFSPEEPEEVAVTPVKPPIQWNVWDRCGTCGSTDSHNWAWIGGVFYCQRCWLD